jgi:hypothetical protein
MSTCPPHPQRHWPTRECAHRKLQGRMFKQRKWQLPAYSQMDAVGCYSSCRPTQGAKEAGGFGGQNSVCTSFKHCCIWSNSTLVWVAVQRRVAGAGVWAGNPVQRQAFLTLWTQA